ncbi:hypothetical protein [Draconibacterium halophilum]|uniref:Uncharacterized protein n=1 Tax=Draconibacterium halophilum TaxID=2706887 RepID=A0A6C0R9A9_9BACT|nr:hypothetical protein [Draconibacterium halophilum]QIA06779.1 hypothetical protein G0Q07_03100 [Draconibacterium halophilum]
MKTIISLLFIGIIISVSNAQDKIREKPYYIFFENNIDGMFKKAESNSDSSFYYTPNLNRGFWFGFQPIDEMQIISKQYFYSNHKNELKDIEWIRALIENRQDPLHGKRNIYIVEELGQDSVKLTRTKHFTVIE